ncbi:DUF2336 domain-containing protein [Devosia sp. Leaf64]|uniref:DUF2336 domain-containing protein n=1 Tax=Devosia sp. Leaf64 TaxID=1736229 RepID=UPI0007140E76|nr:DUF2336 domain-containing protein [Devosia sp. Leaf64]KQN70064.1 hypothetical protein ASE94_13385 [Devosia sp. Leaf64]
MSGFEEGHRAVANIRRLNGENGKSERDKLFRNMARLFSYVSDRCDDQQLAQYDEALCLLAELVELEARAHVARVLAPLKRAPSTVVLKLANDDIEVARPLLEFSNVLCDDDLIDIIQNQSEAHRAAIAGRAVVAERVGAAIVEHGETESVLQLVRNAKAELGRATLEKLVALAADHADLAEDLRNRSDIDWKSLRGEIESAADKVLETLAESEGHFDPVTADKINAVVYKRMRNRAGFNSQEWKQAYNQVRALSERRQLDDRALARFARFGYGHHVAASISVLLRVQPEIVVKWLASQDYAAITVALRSAGFTAELFTALTPTLPWRDLPTPEHEAMMASRFKVLDEAEARNIFELWRTHGFRRRNAAPEPQALSA